MGDFVVDTKGHCFLCLQVVRLLPTELSTYSLQYFSRYLKMDMRKVFSTNGLISPDLLAKVQKAKLKAELCEECASMTRRLSNLYRQLEKIETEMAFYVKEIQQTLEVKTDQFNRLVAPDFKEKLEIVNALRNEATRKCCDILDRRIAPRVNVQKQTKRQLNYKIFKIKSRSRTNSFSNTQTYSSSSEPVDRLNPMNEADVKLEPTYSTISMSMEDCDNDYNDNESVSSLEDSKIDLDNSAMSSAAIDVVQKPPRSTKLPKELVVPRRKFNPNTGKYKCETCLKEFLQSSYFYKHYRNVHLKIKHKCSLCEKEFSSRERYTQHHKNVHLNIRYKCSLCGSTFTEKSSYLQHNQAVHMGVRFKCKGCDKTYSHKRDVARHQRKNNCLQE